MSPPKNNSNNSVGKSTRSSHPELLGPGDFKRGSGKKELPPDHRVSVSNPLGVQEPVPHGDSHRQLSGSGHVSGTSNQEPPLVGGTHDNRCVDFVNRGMESYYRSLAENSAGTNDPTKPNSTVPATGQGTTPGTGEQLPDPGHSSPTSSHPRGSRPEYRASVFDEIFRVGRMVQGAYQNTRDPFLENQTSSRWELERAVAQIQKSLPTLSVSLSRELSTPLSSKISLLQDSVCDQLKAIQFSLSNLHASCNAQASSDKSHLKLLQDVSAECISLTKAVRNIQNPSDDNLVSMSSFEERLNRALRTSQDEVVAHLVSKPECDSAKLVQVIQELDARVHRVEALLEANLHKETEFPYVHSSEPVSSGIDTARIQTIVENTMSKHIACLESVLITRLNQTTRRETDDVELSEDLEQKLEIHSENQRKAFCKLSDRLDRDSHLLHEKIDRATGQFRSGEARLRDEVVELSQLIRDHGSQTRNETTTSPPVQNRRMPQSTGQAMTQTTIASPLTTI
ncbi:hypothetical protein H4Q26_009525 [Puccinia striiformis f. sp. tritici PST-130]|nr:hypothetical protein H4Q26_009525 [Puccinia striiformis f. sp. tritici PST-130]